MHKVYMEMAIENTTVPFEGHIQAHGNTKEDVTQIQQRRERHSQEYKSRENQDKICIFFIVMFFVRQAESRVSTSVFSRRGAHTLAVRADAKQSLAHGRCTRFALFRWMGPLGASESETRASDSKLLPVSQIGTGISSKLSSHLGAFAKK